MRNLGLCFQNPTTLAMKENPPRSPGGFPCSKSGKKKPHNSGRAEPWGEILFRRF
jgi:hypothetical protein